MEVVCPGPAEKDPILYTTAPPAQVVRGKCFASVQQGVLKSFSMGSLLLTPSLKAVKGSINADRQTTHLLNSKILGQDIFLMAPSAGPIPSDMCMIVLNYYVKYQSTRSVDSKS